MYAYKIFRTTGNYLATSRRPSGEKRNKTNERKGTKEKFGGREEEEEKGIQINMIYRKPLYFITRTT